MKLAYPIIATLSALFAFGTAFAQEGTQEFSSQVLSSKTRAEVVAELHQAQVGGRQARSDDSFGSFPAAATVSTRNREDVVAELKEAQRARALDVRNYAGTYGGFRLGEIRSTRSRADVREETLQTMRAQHGLSRGERTRG